MKPKIKISIIIAVEFIAIAVMLLLIFFAGKKSYTVTFDLNGGTLISGDLEQTVSQGKSATPPTVAKAGCYLHSWSASFKQITRDVTIKAVWEWETSVGLDYKSEKDSNYCEISGSFSDLYGDVYVGAYHDEKQVLGIHDEVFKGRTEIENIYMLDGIITIGDSVFEGCTSVKAIELPATLRKLGEYAMKDCTSLESIVLTEGLKVISRGTFENCTSLTSVTLPESLESIEHGAFEGCTSLTEIIIPESVTSIRYDSFKDSGLLTVKAFIKEALKPAGWEDECFGSADMEWEYVPPIEDETADNNIKNDKR